MRRYLLPSALISAVLAGAAGAQCTAGPTLPLRPGTMVGFVTDTSNAPLEGIRIMIANPRRDVRTDLGGHFFIDSLPPGTYQVSLRRVGFEPAMASVEVKAAGGSARICMGIEPRGLPAMVTSIFRGGLSGIVGDTAYQAVPSAEVRTMATRHVTSTDTAGAFFLDLEKGNYVVLVYKKGFARQIVSVTIPKDSGRQIALWLTRADGRENRLAMAYDGLRERLLRKTEFRDAMLTRQDLLTSSFAVPDAVSAAAMHPVNPLCNVAIGNEPGFFVPLWSLDKDEIELFEVSRGTAVSPRGPKSINSRGTAVAAPRGGSSTGDLVCPGLTVWLRP